jgi:probable HAF family extracellular repeat protein
MGKLFKAMGILALLLSAADPAKAVVQYAVTPLGTFWPFAMNNHGDVVGFSQDSDTGYFTAVLYNGGPLKSLGSLGGTYNIAYGINDNGQIVGVSSTSGGSYHAFSYSNGAMSDLGTFGGLGSCAYGINNAGQIVGSINTSGNDYSAYLLTNGVVSNLNTLGAPTMSALRINNIGQIIGSSDTPSGSVHGYIYQNGNMTDLGTLGDYSNALEINDKGQVVGLSTTTDWHAHAFLYSDGQMINLDPEDADGEATDINNSGQIVGGSYTHHAFIYENGHIYDLNSMIDSTLNIDLNGAMCINDNGQIVAHDGYFNVYLLTPIPEPSNSLQLAIITAVAGILVLYKAKLHRFIARFVATF